MNNTIKIGLSLAVVIVLTIGGYGFLKKDKAPYQNFTTYKDFHLTEASKKIYTDKLNEISKQLGSSISDAEKYGLYIQQGFNFYGLGQLQDAKNSYEKALQIKSDDAAAYNALYQTQLEMGDNLGAESSLKKALDLYPVSADAWRKYIQFEADIMHRDDNAINGLYIQAINKTNSNVDIMTVYAQFLEKTGNLQAAKEYWQKAIIANPKGKKIYQAEVDRLDKLLKQLPK
jgi:tetratricopeptide (TPR) repeat protein